MNRKGTVKAVQKSRVRKPVQIAPCKKNKLVHGRGVRCNTAATVRYSARVFLCFR
jgi:hypothetical protein